MGLKIFFKAKIQKQLLGFGLFVKTSQKFSILFCNSLRFLYPQN